MKPLDILIALAVPVVWGLGFVFAKGAIGHFPPILLIALRFSVTALALVWFVPRPTGRYREVAAIAFVSAAIQYSMSFTALKYLDASTAGMIVQLEVPLLVLMGWLILKDRPSLKKTIGIAVSFSGVLLMTGDAKLQTATVWLFVLLTALVFWALGQIMVRRHGEKHGETGGFQMVAWVALFASPQLFVSSWIFEDGQIESLRTAGWDIWATVVYLGLVMTALGYGLWYHLLGRYPVSQAGPFLLLVPVTTLAGGVLILGEDVSWQVLAGGAVIIAGVASILLERRRPIPPPP